MQETQTFEDELKTTINLNSVLLARNEELEAKLAEESQSKEGNLLLAFYFENHTRVYFGLILTLSCRIQGLARGSRHHPW
jgi:hypothetical protein